MEIIKKYVPLSLFLCYSGKLFILNDFSLEKVLALAIFAALAGLFEYKLHNKEVKELAEKAKQLHQLTEEKLKKYEAELEPLKSRVSSLTMLKNSIMK